MKTFKSIMLVGAFYGLLSGVCLTAQADETTDAILNWASYDGVDASVPANPRPTQLYDPDTLTKNNVSAVLAAAAALPFLVDTASNITYVPSSLSTFTPTYLILTTMPASTSNDGYNIWSGFTTPSTEKITAMSNIDQTSYSSTLQEQLLSNFLRTVDYTYCTSDNTSSTPVSSECDYLTSFNVLANYLGAGSSINTSNDTVSYGSLLPNAKDVVSKKNIDGFLPEVNADTFLAPFMYNQDSGKSSTSRPSTSQEAQAGMYVRILSGQFGSSNLASYSTYNSLVSDLSSTDTAKQQEAFDSLANYNASLRQSMAVTSMGTSALVDILSQRVKNSATNTSPAFENYRMATYRLNPPTENTGSTENEWMKNLQTASSDALLRELNVTNAQIQWQLYRTNQLLERLVAIDATILLLQAQDLRANVQLEEPSASEDSSTDSSE